MASGPLRRSANKQRSKSESPKENQTPPPCYSGDDGKPMSRDKKIQLGINIAKLPSCELDRVLSMILSREPNLSVSDPNELDIDLEKLQPSTLREVQSYVDECLRKLSSGGYKQGQACGKAHKRIHHTFEPAARNIISQSSPTANTMQGAAAASSQAIPTSPGWPGCGTSRRATAGHYLAGCDLVSKPLVSKPNAATDQDDSATEEQLAVAMENLRVPLLPPPVPSQTLPAAQPPGDARNRRRPRRPHQPCGRPGCYAVAPLATASQGVPVEDSTLTATDGRRYQSGVATRGTLL
ncbi:hypothetical protein HPB48_017146 [Haemaphysalis longicornis]|uniref:NET domain-containing protein n=1 Tax=Haemaphysalis longicornis TaxID=44386 RepID=A0A9J6FM92_HAELO|nr:hypothetical protein HPB48_017146 [Haemaphysalis longicornis]